MSHLEDVLENQRSIGGNIASFFPVISSPPNDCIKRRKDCFGVIIFQYAIFFKLSHAPKELIPPFLSLFKPCQLFLLKFLKKKSVVLQ